MMLRALRTSAVLVWAALILTWGVQLRSWVWETSRPIRFQYDINNGFWWGNFASRVGYFNIYNEIGDPFTRRRNGQRDLDYGPLRLGVMSAWVNWVHTTYPDATRREQSQAFHAPLLWFNTTIETLAAVATFVIVMLVMKPTEWRPWVAIFGASLTWFNPLILVNAHSWPQWDVWPTPFYLFALVAALRRQWLIGGLLIGVGSMLKGQLLMVGWTFPLWALFIGDWRGALKFIIGLATSLMMIAIVWELSIYLPGEGGYAAYASSWKGPMRRVDWPAVAWVSAWVVAAIALPRKFSPTLICFALAATLGSTYFLFNANFTWFKCGIMLGTEHYPSMQLATTANLTSILSMVYGWNNPYELMFSFKNPLDWLHAPDPANPFAPVPVTMKALLIIIYFSLSIWCVFWTAFWDRRRDARFLLAITTPWLLFYCIPPQIHERYLLFFSACVGAFVACGPRWVLMGMILTVVGFTATVHQMFIQSQPPTRALTWQDATKLTDIPHRVFAFSHYLVVGTFPGIAWMLLLAALIFLCAIALPRPRSERILPPLVPQN